MSNEVDTETLKLWLDRLRTASGKERAQAASELSYVQIRSRGAVRTRGGFGTPAASGFVPEVREDAMRTVLAALKDESAAVRREVAFALGQWGDEEAARILRDLVAGDHQDPAEEVRRSAVAALGTIGGSTAVRTLCEVAEHDPAEKLRYAALASLTELGLQDTQRGTRTRTVVRTRGTPVRPRAGLGPSAEEAVRALQRIRDNESEKEYLRRMAEAALAPLVE